jgi:hypothetical protein
MYPGYVTEKLGDAILAGLPSIYYGDVENALRRFPNTFVQLDELTYNSFLKSKNILMDNYDSMIKGVYASFNNSDIWMESFVNTLFHTINKIKRI